MHAKHFGLPKTESVFTSAFGMKELGGKKATLRDGMFAVHVVLDLVNRSWCSSLVSLNGILITHLSSVILCVIKTLVIFNFDMSFNIKVFSYNFRC